MKTHFILHRNSFPVTLDFLVCLDPYIPGQSSYFCIKIVGLMKVEIGDTVTSDISNLIIISTSHSNYILVSQFPFLI